MSSDASSLAILSELEEALRRLETRERNFAAAQKALDELNAEREESGRKFGTVNIAVELIRECRE